MTHLRTVAAIGALILATTSCGTGMDGHPTSETSSMTPPASTADPATLFNPCKDIPAAFMKSEGFGNGEPRDPFEHETNGVMWKGCHWLMTNGYNVGIATTTLTLEMIKAQSFDEYTEFSVDGRPAVSYRRLPEYGKTACVADIELGAGSLDFDLENPPSAPGTQGLESCELVRAVASNIAQFLPK